MAGNGSSNGAFYSYRIIVAVNGVSWTDARKPKNPHFCAVKVSLQSPRGDREAIASSCWSSGASLRVHRVLLFSVDYKFLDSLMWISTTYKAIMRNFSLAGRIMFSCQIQVDYFDSFYIFILLAKMEPKKRNPIFHQNIPEPPLGIRPFFGVTTVHVILNVVDGTVEPQFSTIEFGEKINETERPAPSKMLLQAKL